MTTPATPLYFKKLALLLCIETTVGTIKVPVSTDAIQASDVSLTPIEGDEVEENIMRPFFGASESTLVTIFRKIAFSVGFAGVGVQGAMPGWGSVLRACAARATSVEADPEDEGVIPCTIFDPVTDGIESATIYAVIDKQLYKMTGARGNAKIATDAKQIPKWQFEFTGAFHPVEAVEAMPTVSYAKFQRTLGVNKINTTISLDSFAAACSSFSLDFGNQVVKQDLMNVDDTDITGRVSTGSVTIRNTAVGVKNWIELAHAGSKVPLLLKHGQDVTNTVQVSVPRAQLGKPSFSEQEGIQMITIPFRAIPSDSGNDEWAITA